MWLVLLLIYTLWIFSAEKVWRVFSLQPTLKKLVSHYSPFKMWQRQTQQKQQLGYQEVQYTQPKTTETKYYKPKEYGPHFFKPQYQPVSYADDSFWCVWFYLLFLKRCQERYILIHFRRQVLMKSFNKDDK